MLNEILLVLSVPLIYGFVLLSYRLFGKSGLYAMTVIATVFANIEVMILIEGFGIVQTLGNVLFASTYLITDILSENHGKKSASKAVWIGIFASVMMLVLTGYFRLYEPASSDSAMPHIRELFSLTPRLMLASFLGFTVSQWLDVRLYHLIWDKTTKKSGQRRGYLWLRNNLATMISQVFNTVIFSLVAFAGVYSLPILLSVMLSSYIIYIITSLLDTPFVYLARLMNDKNKTELLH